MTSLAHRLFFFGRLLVVFENRLLEMRKVRLLGQLAKIVVRQIRAVLRERTTVKEREYRTSNFLEDFIASRRGGRDVQTNVHVRLKGQ
jgi:hypothetical protein